MRIYVGQIYLVRNDETAESFMIEWHQNICIISVHYQFILGLFVVCVSVSS